MATTEEAAQLVVVYRDTQTFVGPAKIHAQAALRQYANDVMAKEWKSHGLLLAHNSGDALNPVWAAYRSRPGADPNGAVEGRLHELEQIRHLRNPPADLGPEPPLHRNESVHREHRRSQDHPPHDGSLARRA